MPRVFFSHSSQDKDAVRHLAQSLRDNGIDVWLDEWSVRVGESISQEIERGPKAADYVAIWISKTTADSGWVDREWRAKFGDEVATSQARILPVLADDVQVPALLRERKYADFRTSYEAGLNELLQVLRPPDPSPEIALIQSGLIEQLQREPDLLHALDWRQFEALVAELYRASGYEVTSTSTSKDGGRDIIALSRSPEIKLLIEVKRRSKDAKIGLDEVRALHGVAERDNATKGVLVTTSDFTRDAMQYLEQNKHRLEGINGDRLLQWLQESIADESTDIGSSSVEFLLDPGTATAQEIADLFYQISTLYRLAGGRGIEFTVTDAREPVAAEELL